MKENRSLLEGLSSTVAAARKRIDARLEPLHRTVHDLQIHKSELSRLEFALSRMKKGCLDDADCVWHLVRLSEFDGKKPKVVEAFFARELLLDTAPPIVGPAPGRRPSPVVFSDPLVGSIHDAQKMKCPGCKKQGYVVGHYDLKCADPGRLGWELTLHVLCVDCPGLKPFSRHTSCDEVDN